MHHHIRVITLCLNWSIDAGWFHCSSCSFCIWTNRCSSCANNKRSYCRPSKQGEAEFVSIVCEFPNFVTLYIERDCPLLEGSLCIETIVRIYFFDLKQCPL